MDNVKLELNAICRVCLHNGEMEPIFGANGEDTAISLKIGQCSSIELIHGTNMPEHICTECIDDLEMAYRFRTNCESSDAILKSFVETAALNEMISNGVTCRATEEAINNHPMIKSSSADDGEVLPPATSSKLQLGEHFAANEAVLVQQKLPSTAKGSASMSANRLISDDAIIEGVEFDAVDRGMLKVKVQGEDQYVEYRVNVSDVDLLSETATFQLVQDDDDEIAVVIQSVDDAITFEQSADTLSADPATIDADGEHPSVFANNIKQEPAITCFDENCLEVVLQENAIASMNDRSVVSNDDDGQPSSVSPPYVLLLNSDETDAIIEESNEATDFDGSTSTGAAEAAVDAQIGADDVDEFLDPNTEILQIKAVKSNKTRQTARNRTGGGGQQQQQQQPPTKRQSAEAKPPKVCEICGNQYKFQHALDGHMRRHRNEKPFECHICGKGFVINFELSRHMRTHTGLKPYACSYCERRFSDFGSRAKHERTHTGERPYPCELCGKSFAYSHVLTSHMLTHTGVKRFGCEICGKRFAKSHHLKAHMNTHMKSNQHHVSPAMILMMATADTSSSRPAGDSIDRITADDGSDSPMVAESDDVDVMEGLAAAYGADGGLLMSDITGRIIADDEETGENFILDMSELVDEDEQAAVHLIHYNASNGNELPHC